VLTVEGSVQNKEVLLQGSLISGAHQRGSTSPDSGRISMPTADDINLIVTSFNAVFKTIFNVSNS